MLLDTWARRVRADCSSPSRAAEMASPSVALVTEAKNALGDRDGILLGLYRVF